MQFGGKKEVFTASIIRALMMEAVSTSETSVNFYQNTQRNFPEDRKSISETSVNFYQTIL
jgi:hypothetical protein